MTDLSADARKVALISSGGGDNGCVAKGPGRVRLKGGAAGSESFADEVLNVRG